jgi:hypothetical protein
MVVARHTRAVYAAAPRVDRRFIEKLDGLDDRSVSMAETYRRTRDLAAQMGIPRPSYERVRVELKSRRTHRDQRHDVRGLVFELAYNTRPADVVLADLLELLD